MLAALIGAAILSAAIWWLLPEEAAIGQLENIHGIPFPSEKGRLVVTEKLAHADVYFTRSPVAHTAYVTATLNPISEQSLAIGIRENSFWLSYPKHTIFQDRAPAPDIGPRTVTVAIPLTDKLPDQDGSLDLMFFAPGRTDEPDEGADDSTRWLLYDLRIISRPALPTVTEIKDVIRRFINKERVL